MASSNKTSNIHRGKPYALMLLLAFGAAVLGVMVLHKLSSERNAFSVSLSKKKIMSCLLFIFYSSVQREQEFNKDARKKIGEMKTKVYSLRSQKLDLDRRVSEMESTIASLRDEREVVESTLEEKKNEIKMLTEEGLNSTFPQVSALRDMIKMKEREIEHLKLRLNMTETNSTDVGKRVESENDNPSPITGSSEKVTTGENISQTDVLLKNRVNTLNETEKINDLDEDGQQMRQQATLYKWSNKQGENTENEASQINTDEKQEKITADSQSTGILNPIEEVVNTSSTHHGNPRDKESREMTSSVTSGLKLEKSDVGVDGESTQVRRRYYRGNRSRDARATETSALGNQEEAVMSNNNQREMGLTEGYPAETEILNHTLGSTETKPKGDEEADNGSSMGKDGNINGNGNGNVKGKGKGKGKGPGKLTIDGKSKRRADTDANVSKQNDDINSGHDIDADRKLLKMPNIDVSKIKDGDEEGKEIEVEEGEGDDLDEIREPEINREDIKRFAESDLDEEEAEEAADEAEFQTNNFAY